MRISTLYGCLLALLLLALSLPVAAYQPYGFQRVSYAPSPAGYPQHYQPGYYPMPPGYYPQPYPTYRQPPAADRASATPAPQRIPPEKSTPSRVDTASQPPQIAPKAEKRSSKVPAKPKVKQRPETRTQTDTGGLKLRFIETLTPLITEENRRLKKLRQRVVKLVGQLNQEQPLTAEEGKQLRNLATRYRIDGNPLTERDSRDELVRKIDIIPLPLTLAQAANESAWGKSRFAQEGNNLFGIWTYDPTKGIIPKGREAGKKHLVRKFDTLDESVRYYMFTLNSHPAYKALRKIRSQQRVTAGQLDSKALANGLEKYSAKGKEYIRLIQQIIDQHNLASLEQPPREA